MSAFVEAPRSAAVASRRAGRRTAGWSSARDHGLDEVVGLAIAVGEGPAARDYRDDVATTVRGEGRPFVLGARAGVVALAVKEAAGSGRIMRVAEV